MIADNTARAMRVVEVMSDLRNLQHDIARIQLDPLPEDYYLEGYMLLRNVVIEAKAVLAFPYTFGYGSQPQGTAETAKVHLQAYV